MSEKRSREAYILNRLAQDGTLSVAALSRDLGVSEVTIRTNLKDLEAKGLLQRTHGGAQASTYQTVLERQRHQVGQKERVAAAAAQLVHDSDAIMIEAGTTTALIVKGLTGRQGVQVVTNSTLTFATARLNRALQLIMTGGTFHHESESLVGSRALATVHEFNVRLAFIGTDGFTAERGLTTQFAEGADVIRAMHARAEETWLVADSTKYGRAGFVNVLSLADVAGVITDSDLAPESREALEDAGVQLIIA